MHGYNRALKSDPEYKTKRGYGATFISPGAENYIELGWA
jgi:hypothetical protein